MNRLAASAGLLAAGILIIGCAQPERTTDPAAVRQEIEATNQRFKSYVAERNVDSLMTLYSSDAILMPQGMEMVSGQDAIRAAFQGMFDSGVEGIGLQTVEVHASGDIAYEVGRYTIQGPGGSDVDRGKYVVVWKEEGGTWKLHRDIFNTDLAMAADTAATPPDTTRPPADTTSI